MAVIAIVVAAAALMLPTLYNFFVGYYVGTGIAVIGLYIAFILPVILRYRMKDEFQPGAWTLGRHYKWIDPIAIVWVFFISIVFLMPPYSISAPWKDGFTWEAVNYAPILVGGALLLFGGWWVLSAKNWFKGPVRHGHRRGARGHGGRARGQRRAAAAADVEEARWRRAPQRGEDARRQPLRRVSQAPAPGTQARGRGPRSRLRG